MKITRLPIVLLLLVFVVISSINTQNIHAQETCTHNGTGWGTASLWSCGRVPLITDDVIIPSGNNSILNVNDAFAANLTIEGTIQFGSNNVNRTLTVANDINVANTGNLVPNSAGGSPVHTLTVSGNMTNNGNVDLRSAASATGSAVVNVIFNGTAVQNIEGTNPIRFNSLTVNDAVHVHIDTQPTVEGSLTNNGTLSQSFMVDNAAFEFLHILNLAGDTSKYRGVNINTVNNLGLVTVFVDGIDTSNGEYCTSTGAGSPDYTERCYTITADNPNNSATVRLWAANSELNDIPTSGLTPYHWNSSASEWQPLSAVTTGSEGTFSYAEGTTSSFSSFLLGGDAAAPTAVSLANIFISSSHLTGFGWAAGLLAVLTLIVIGLWLRPAAHRPAS